jgi:TonB family protein
MSAQIARPRRHSANIFINYRREDSSGHTGRLFDALSGHFAGRLFMDVDTLEPGVDFVEAIEQAVGSCEVLIVVIGREWLTFKDAAGQRRLDDPADFVRLEVETALERKIRVIPVLVQGAQMPRAEELPPSLTRLARRNAIEISDARWAYDVDRLARTIQKILEELDASTRTLAAALEKAAAPPAPAVPAVAAEAVVRPEPVVPMVAAKAAGSPVRLLFLSALVLVAAAGLGASYLKTPQTPIATQATIRHPATSLQPVAKPPAPRSTPLAASTPAASKPPVPSPSPSSTVRKVVIPVQLAGEGRAPREKEEPMKRGDLILDGPGVEEPQPTATPPAMYPSSAGSGRYARVVLGVLVDENGVVADARVESASVDDGSSDAEFRNAALAAARRSHFEPATKNGIPGKMWWGGALTYEFGTKK